MLCVQASSSSSSSSSSSFCLILTSLACPGGHRGAEDDGRAGQVDRFVVHWQFCGRVVCQPGSLGCGRHWRQQSAPFQAVNACRGRVRERRSRVCLWLARHPGRRKCRARVRRRSSNGSCKRAKHNNNIIIIIIIIIINIRTHNACSPTDGKRARRRKVPGNGVALCTPTLY